ncbi:hypothetical protein JTE90_025827 [Oedothorax gibbosus]|uniref:F-box domain-containing protein n=1 Tax=Oedothorax gibbosus TaxID=931172 RepID=A0AAV6UUF3_9ARAC|nr:hypothetical protein JTE90_025827 [Oedothorax gibbosus]
MSSTPRQPRKKRRIDSQERANSIPQEVLPLVSPSQVRKSSKDPNRGMYPKRKDRASTSKESQACPTFSSASQLMQGASTSRASENMNSGRTLEETSEFSDISLAEISIQEEVSPTRKSRKVGKDAPKDPRVRQSFGAKAKRTFSKAKLSFVNQTNNLLRYFKKTKSKEKEETGNSSSDDFEKPSTSKPTDVSWAETSKEPIAPTPAVKKGIEAFFNGSGKYYGLLGEDNEVDSDRPNYFEKLPCHVLELVLCQVPFVDLMRCKSVCSEWNEVINDEAFMHYKKLYYSLKHGRPKGCGDMETIARQYKLSKAEDCFGVLLQFMFEDFNIKPSCDMYERLSENSKAAEAELVLTERFPEVLTKESKVWCIFTTAMLLSETVEDIYDIYKSVCHIKSGASIHDVTNALYCIAAFLLYFRDMYNINHGLHYRVYNAIYWIENSLPSKDIVGAQSLKVAKGLPGQQSIHSYCESKQSNLTYEQIRILNHRFSQPKQIIKIVEISRDW